MYFPVDIHTDLLCYSAVLLGGAENYTPDFGFAISAWLLEIATAGGVSRAELWVNDQWVRKYGYQYTSISVFTDTKPVTCVFTSILSC